VEKGAQINKADFFGTEKPGRASPNNSKSDSLQTDQ